MWEDVFEEWLEGLGIDPFTITLEESVKHHNNFTKNNNI